MCTGYVFLILYYWSSVLFQNFNMILDYSKNESNQMIIININHNLLVEIHNFNTNLNNVNAHVLMSLNLYVLLE
jgi:hypothetical protein